MFFEINNTNNKQVSISCENGHFYTSPIEEVGGDYSLFRTNSIDSINTDQFRFSMSVKTNLPNEPNYTETGGEITIFINEQSGEWTARGVFYANKLARYAVSGVPNGFVPFLKYGYNLTNRSQKMVPYIFLLGKQQDFYGYVQVLFEDSQTPKATLKFSQHLPSLPGQIIWIPDDKISYCLSGSKIDQSTVEAINDAVTKANNAAISAIDAATSANEAAAKNENLVSEALSTFTSR